MCRVSGLVFRVKPEIQLFMRQIGNEKEEEEEEEEEEKEEKEEEEKE